MKNLDQDVLDAGGGSPISWLRFAVVCLLGAGLLYPAMATLLGQTLFPVQARGSLIERNGVVVGSSLIAQPFTSESYFQPRPSAAGYDPRAAVGSNAAPSNPALRDRIVAASTAIAAREGIAPARIPSDLVTASGSGLDPHISPAAAQAQLVRVARVRGMDIARIRALLSAHTDAPTFGVLGQARVNVLELNLALDALTTDP